MSDWTSGYVTDVGYTHGFYRELVPNILSFVALINGFGGPDANGPLTYCELGCGQGFSANLIAAANPNIEVHAVDFNPTHVHGASMLAAMAGSSNIHFYDDGFAEFGAQPDLPEFDIVALHGVYSWISDENRRHIRDFIRRRLKVGGLVYVSYNALPGWSSLLSLRRLMLDQGGSGGSTLERVKRSLEFLDRFAAANPRFLAASATARVTIERFKQLANVNYLAHEYFNADLNAFHHADVVAEMADAKLTYVGSAAIPENLDAATLPPEHVEFLQRASSRVEKESWRDFLSNQQFRRDVFMKGPLPLSPIEAEFYWNRLSFVLSKPRNEISLKIEVSTGEAELRPEIHDPVINALARGPQTIPQLLADPAVRALPIQNVREALAVLVGIDYVQLGLDESTRDARAARTDAFNFAVMSRAQTPVDLVCFASPMTGGAVPADRIAQLFLLARRAGRPDPVQFAWESLTRAGLKMRGDDGSMCESEADNLAQLRKRHEIFLNRDLGVLNGLGIG